MKLVSRLLALTGTLALVVNPAFAATLPSTPSSIGAVAVGGPVGANTVNTGGLASGSLANRFGERLDLKADFGAFGDFRSLPTLPVTIATGSKNLFVSGASFSAADVGKRVVIDGAGPLRPLGYVASVPVSSPGTSTVTPNVVFSGLGSSAAGVYGAAMMAALTAAVGSGGTGCPNGTQTFILTGGNGTAAQVTGTVSGGALSGALTISVAGSYQPGTSTTALLASNPVATTSAAGTCTTYPTINVTWGVGSIFMAGQGMGVALSGATASLSTGGGTLGTPVIAQVATPLSAAILSVFDAQNVVLDTAASTGVTNSNLGFGYGHEDTAALEAAKAASCARFNAGLSPAQIYVPPGDYLIGSTSNPSTPYQCPLLVVGEGTASTQFKMDPAMSGPLFSESDTWGGYAVSGFVNLAGPTGALDFATRSYFRNFVVVGDMSAMNEQDSIVLFDRNDRVNIDNVMGNYIWGSHVKAGALKNKPQAYMRESMWKDVYCNYCGSPIAPVYDFNSAGTGDSTNTNSFFGLNSVPAQGVCVAVRSQAPATSKATTYLNFYDTRCEGGVGANFSPDALIQIGDGVSTGPVTDVNFFGARALSTPIGTSGVKLNSASLAAAPSSIHFYGLTTYGSGRGINVQAAGGIIDFDGVTNSSNDYKLTVGPSTLVKAPIRISAEGGEYGWTKNIDSTSTASVVSPIYMLANGAVVANTHDGSAGGGSAPGASTVDLQTCRTANTQVPTTLGAFITGCFNTAQGAYEFIAGSNSNAQGAYSSVFGNSGADRGRNATGLVFSAGKFANTGDAQTALAVVLRASATLSTSGTVTARATTDGSATGNASDIDNIPAGLHYHMMVSASCTDYTSSGTPIWASWDINGGDLDRRNSSISYVGAFASATAPARSAGLLSSATFSLSADSSLYGVNATFTLPQGTSADTVHCVVTVNNLQEVQ